MEPTAALRISQLDAEELSSAVETSLEQQIQVVLTAAPASLAAVAARLEPEWRLALRSFLWWHSLRARHQTLGQAMLSLSYSRPSTHGFRPLRSSQLWGHFCLAVLGPWLAWRGGDWAGRGSDGRWRRGVRLVEGAAEALSLLHFLVFLSRGGRSSWTERILCLASVHPRPPSLQPLELSLLNRELLWHGFADVAALLYPLFHQPTVQVQRVPNV